MRKKKNDWCIYISKMSQITLPQKRRVKVRNTKNNRVLCGHSAIKMIMLRSVYVMKDMVFELRITDISVNKNASMKIYTKPTILVPSISLFTSSYKAFSI